MTAAIGQYKTVVNEYTARAPQDPPKWYQPWLDYKYFDTPDGEDVFKKMFTISKYAAAGAFVTATCDVVWLKKPVGILPTLAVYNWWMAPLVGMGLTYTAFTTISLNIRGKDDCVNHWWGGVVAGTLCGTWSKCKMNGTLGALSFGVIGMVKKYGVEQGHIFFPAANPITNSLWHKKFDFTITKDDQPKGWVTNAADA